MTNTDTPRTDAIEFRHCPPQPKELLKKHQDAYAERLNQHIKTQNLIAREEAKILQRWKEWGMTHEEKGKRLEANLRRAAEIAEDSTESLMDWDENRRSETQRKNYAELEATLNQDNK